MNRLKIISWHCTSKVIRNCVIILLLLHLLHIDLVKIVLVMPQIAFKCNPLDSRQIS